MYIMIYLLSLIQLSHFAFFVTFSHSQRLHSGLFSYARIENVQKTWMEIDLCVSVLY